MALPPPVVRHMLLCDDVLPDPSSPKKLLLIGLTSCIKPTRLPFLLRKWTVYVELTNGRGSGDAGVDVVEADTGTVVFVRPRLRLTFGPDVLAIGASIHRLIDCEFQRAGLYWVRFLYNNAVLAEQDFLVREPNDATP